MSRFAALIGFALFVSAENLHGQQKAMQILENVAGPWERKCEKIEPVTRWMWLTARGDDFCHTVERQIHLSRKEDKDLYDEQFKVHWVAVGLFLRALTDGNEAHDFLKQHTEVSQEVSNIPKLIFKPDSTPENRKQWFKKNDLWLPDKCEKELDDIQGSLHCIDEHKQHKGWMRPLAKFAVTFVLGGFLVYLLKLTIYEIFYVSEMMAAFAKDLGTYCIYFLKYILISTAVQILTFLLAMVWCRGYIGVKPLFPRVILPASVVTHWFFSFIPGVYLVWKIYIEQDISNSVLSLVHVLSTTLIARAVADFVMLDLDITMWLHHIVCIIYGILPIFYYVFGWSQDAAQIPMSSSDITRHSGQRVPLVVSLSTCLLLAFSGAYDLGAFLSGRNPLNVISVLKIINYGMHLCNILLSIVMSMEWKIEYDIFADFFRWFSSEQNKSVLLKRSIALISSVILLFLVVALSVLRLQDSVKVREYPDTNVKLITSFLALISDSEGKFQKNTKIDWLDENDHPQRGSFGQFLDQSRDTIWKNSLDIAKNVVYGPNSVPSDMEQKFEKGWNALIVENEANYQDHIMNAMDIHSIMRFRISLYGRKIGHSPVYDLLVKRFYDLVSEHDMLHSCIVYTHLLSIDWAICIAPRQRIGAVGKGWGELETWEDVAKQNDHEDVAKQNVAKKLYYDFNAKNMKKLSGIVGKMRVENKKMSFQMFVGDLEKKARELYLKQGKENSKEHKKKFEDRKIEDISMKEISDFLVPEKILKASRKDFRTMKTSESIGSNFEIEVNSVE